MNSTQPLLTRLQGTSPLQRPRFTPGLLLEDDDLTTAVNYTREVVRTMLRSLFTCGVVCGLDVTSSWDKDCDDLIVQVGCGVALDCRGEMIVVPKAQTIRFDRDCDPWPNEVWVTICYREQCCAPRDVSCSDDDTGAREFTRIREGFELRLYRDFPNCTCTCGRRPETGDPVDADCPPGSPSGSGQVLHPGPLDDAPADPCDCYDDHRNGKCNCCGGCECVMLGKIALEATGEDHLYDPNAPRLDPPEVLSHGVKYVRPVLVGYFKDCYELQKQQADANASAAFSRPTMPPRSAARSARKSPRTGGKPEGGTPPSAPPATPGPS